MRPLIFVLEIPPTGSGAYPLGPEPAPGAAVRVADEKSEWDPILGLAPHITFNVYLLKGYIPGAGGFQGSGAELAYFDGYTAATDGRFPGPSAPYLDVENIGGGSDGCEAGFQAREMGTSCVRLAWRQPPVGPRIRTRYRGAFSAANLPASIRCAFGARHRIGIEAALANPTPVQKETRIASARAEGVVLVLDRRPELHPATRVAAIVAGRFVAHLRGD